MPVTRVVERRILGVQVEAGLPAFEQRFELARLFARGDGFVGHAPKSSAALVRALQRKICARQHSCAALKCPANNIPHGERPLGVLRSRRTAAALIFLAFVCAAGAAGVARRGGHGRARRPPVFSAEAIEREIANVVSPDVSIVLPAAVAFLRRLVAGRCGTPRSTARSRTATSTWCSRSESSRRNRPRAAPRCPKPVIAPLVIDPVLQGFPLIEGRSGRRNFTYVADFQSVANEVRAFHDIVGFKYLVALVDDSLARRAAAAGHQGDGARRHAQRAHRHRARGRRRAGGARQNSRGRRTPST